MMKILLIFLLMTAGLIASTGADGGYAGAFLRMGFEARTKALGDAFVAVPEGAVAGIYNPATLPHLSARQAVASLSFLPLDRSLDYLGVAVPIRPQATGKSGQPLNAGVMIGWIHAGTGDIDGRDFAGNHTQDLSNSEHAFFMGFSVSPAPWLGIGLSGKILHNRIPDIAEQGGALTSNGFGIDLGVFAKPFKDLTLGAVLRDDNSKYIWNTDKVYERGSSTTYKFPRVFRLGAAYRIPQQWLLLVADWESSDVLNPRYHFGAEATFQQLAALRIGWDHDKPTFGLGFTLEIWGKMMGMNYAFVPGLEALSPDHVVSWTVDF